MGIDAIDRFDLRLTAVGEHVALDTETTLNADPSGMLAMYEPASPGPNRFAPLVPKTGVFWAAQTFRLDRMYPMFKSIFDVMSEEDEYAPDLAELEEMMEANTGIRLKQDIMDRLGDCLGISVDAEGLKNVIQSDSDEADGICYAFTSRRGASCSR